MQYCTFIFKIFYASSYHTNKNLILKNHLVVLFTQGMVCHETYKDENNNWVSPDELITKDGKNI